jgi:hypothetical protein
MTKTLLLSCFLHLQSPVAHSYLLLIEQPPDVHKTVQGIRRKTPAIFFKSQSDTQKRILHQPTHHINFSLSRSHHSLLIHLRAHRSILRTIIPHIRRPRALNYVARTSRSRLVIHDLAHAVV